MAKYLLAIACEEYGDPKIQAAPYCEKDALEFAQALQQHGFEPDDQTVLVNTAATKATIESRLRRLSNNLEPEDSLFLYYAGHAFAKGTEGYLAGGDALRSDLEATSVSLKWLFERLSKSECGQVAVFLDVRRASLAEAGLKAVAEDVSDDALEALAEALESGAVFVSCRAGEVSWTTGRLNQSVWSHHLIEAFNGEAKRALVKNRHLTAEKLQDHLSEAVARGLLKAFTEPKTQTPWMAGGAGSALPLADFQEIFGKRKAADAAGAAGANHILKATLSRSHTVPIKALAGFNKSAHKVPDRASPFAEQLIAKLASDDLKNDLNTKHAKLKREFKFKRTDMDVSGPADGAGTIITPYFTYFVTVAQDAADPTLAVWRRTVTDVKDAKRVLSPEFTRVFEKDFDTIELGSPTRIDLDEFIDRVEALEDERIQLNYDPNPTHVEVSIKGVEGELRVDDRTMFFGAPRPTSPNELAAALMKIQRTLVDERQVPLISSDDASKT